MRCEEVMSQAEKGPLQRPKSVRQSCILRCVCGQRGRFSGPSSSTASVRCSTLVLSHRLSASCLLNLFAANSPAVIAAEGPTEVIHNFSSGVGAATGSTHPIQSRFISVLGLDLSSQTSWTLSPESPSDSPVHRISSQPSRIIRMWFANVG